MVKVVIIDDEKAARETIKSLLCMSFQDIKILGEADSVDSGYDLLSSVDTDIVFLDIDIIGGTGFNILQRFDRIPFKIVFVTAYNDFAIKAIKFNALDYILKPVNEFEFISGVERVIREVRRSVSTENYRGITEDNIQGNFNRITLKTYDCIHLVDLTDIIRCESENSYTTFYLVGGDQIVVSKSIKYYEDLLSESDFLRVHQSHLINKKYLSKYVKKDGGYIKMCDDSSIPVSLRKRNDVMKLFG